MKIETSVLKHVWAHRVCPELGCLDSTAVHREAETPQEYVWRHVCVVSASKLPQSALATSCAVSVDNVEMSRRLRCLCVCSSGVPGVTAASRDCAGGAS